MSLNHNFQIQKFELIFFFFCWKHNFTMILALNHKIKEFYFKFQFEMDSNSNETQPIYNYRQNAETSILHYFTTTIK